MLHEAREVLEVSVGVAGLLVEAPALVRIRPFFILRIVRPRIFESKFRDHCAKKLDGALRKSTSFV